MLKNRKGQGMVEYILIIFLVVVVVIAGIRIFGSKANTMITKANDTISQEAKLN